jgi:hypothetical protein
MLSDRAGDRVCAATWPDGARPTPRGHPQQSSPWATRRFNVSWSPGGGRTQVRSARPVSERRALPEAAVRTSLGEGSVGFGALRRVHDRIGNDAAIPPSRLSATFDLMAAIVVTAIASSA